MPITQINTFDSNSIAKMPSNNIKTIDFNMEERTKILKTPRSIYIVLNIKIIIIIIQIKQEKNKTNLIVDCV